MRKERTQTPSVDCRRRYLKVVARTTRRSRSVRRWYRHRRVIATGVLDEWTAEVSAGPARASLFRHSHDTIPAQERRQSWIEAQ
jgi:hypothetical protein